MKILIIANTKIVFGNELKSELEKHAKDVYLLDFESLMLSHGSLRDSTYFNMFSKYKKIPKLHMFFRIYYIAKVIKAIGFELVNIHYSRWVYLFLLPVLKHSKFIMTFYGSDFYRTKNLTKKIQSVIYKKADVLTFTNPLTRDAFVRYYKNYEKKSHVCRFGLKTLDYIDKNRLRPKNEMKEALGYKRDKIIVTCGYNATRAQQHHKILKELLLLEEEILKNVQFVFPMTYGNTSYKEEIKSALEKSRLDYLVLEEFLYEDDNAYVKLASDIMINLLETDSFSGSMQEFLYAQNHVITGSWLPYELFDKEGIVYTKIESTDELSPTLTKVLAKVDTDQIDLSVNEGIISILSSWKNNIDCWINVYEKN